LKHRKKSYSSISWCVWEFVARVFEQRKSFTKTPGCSFLWIKTKIRANFKTNIRANFKSEAFVASERNQRIACHASSNSSYLFCSENESVFKNQIKATSANPRIVNPRCSMFFSSGLSQQKSTRNPMDYPQKIPNHPRFLYLNSSRLLLLLGEDDLHIDKEEVQWRHGGLSSENMAGELPCLLFLPINNMANIIIHSLRLVKHVYY